MAAELTFRSREVEAPDALAAIEYCFEQGWTDGLPVVPPTRAAVAAAIAASGRPADQVVATIPPREAAATVEQIAVNAVLAGCRPEYLPVVIAAVETMADPVFNLNGVQACTDGAAPLIIVNGPIAREIGLNSAGNVFGQGWRANATIGRAIRLILMNLGGGYPQETDMSTLGQPSKYTYCIAENEAVSPWEPLHVEQGFRADQSVVTVFPADAPTSIGDLISDTPEKLLTSVADTLCVLGNLTLYYGGETFLVFGPTHAAIVAQAGWSKSDVRRFLFEHARMPIEKLMRTGHQHLVPRHYWPEWIDIDDPTGFVPLLRAPEDLIILVAGGEAGRFSAGIAGWGYQNVRSVTRPIQ
ncbi:MAG TPA: hypothetical protein VHL09_09975 [Dehalococcoidia bacterium]|nr:hypothetical protein [Dehalococcoidia bacterium]